MPETEDHEGFWFYWLR